MSKKILFNVLILSFLALGFAKAQNIQFEDAKFKAMLLSSPQMPPDPYPSYGQITYYGQNQIIAKDVNGNVVAIDTNGDGEISQAEALNIYQLDIHDDGRTGSDGIIWDVYIKSMKGIEYFTNLTQLTCTNFISLESLDLSALTKLKELNYSGAFFVNVYGSVFVGSLSNLILPETPTLESLKCSGNMISNLDFLSGHPNLKKLTLDYINAENINITGAQFPHLEELSVLQRIPDVNVTVSDLPELTTFNCGVPSNNSSDLSSWFYYDNNVPNIILSLSNLPKIDTLNIQGKNITINNLPNLTSLNCSARIDDPVGSFRPGSVESLVLNGVPKLTEIYADNHKLKSLDLSKLPNLVTLSLWGRNDDWPPTSTLENLDVSKNINLQTLYLSENNISTLDVSKNINLQTLGLYNNANLKTLDVSHNINLVKLGLYGCTGLTSLYMKNGVKKTFYTSYGDPRFYLFPDSYYLNNTNLNYICCDEDEINAVKDYMQSFTQWDNNTQSEYTLNPTVTSDCETYGLGTEDLSPQAKATLYPNPVKDVLYFSASGKVAKAEVYDLNGRLIKTSAVSNNSVNVSSLSKGVYFIILHTDKGTVKEKFIKN